MDNVKIYGPASPAQLAAKRRQILAICETAGPRFVRFTFIKRDGTVRELTTCNTATTGLVGDAAAPSRKQAVETRKQNNPNLLNRFDVHKRGWRSINLDTVVELQVDGVTTQFHKGPWLYAEVTGAAAPVDVAGPGRREVYAADRDPNADPRAAEIMTRLRRAFAAGKDKSK